MKPILNMIAMNNLFHISVLTVAIAAGNAFADTTQTGLAPLEIEDARTDRPLSGFVWYPTDAERPAEMQHSNAVWQGIEAVLDAEPSPGEHPLVVLSHGMYGNAMNQTWLAEALVQEGYIVAAISHPGTSTWSRDPDQARQMWDRPGDVSRVIDHMLTDPTMAQHVNAERVYMAGHSLGGYTAVALAGGRYDDAKMDGFCAQNPGELVCGIFDRWQIAKTPEDTEAMQADLSDPRIRGFAVFDLGGTQTFSTASLGRIDRPMLVIGAPEDIAGLDLDIESRALVAALQEDTVTYMEPESLSHFDFLGRCKPGGLQILADEEPGDEVICIKGGAERETDHALIARAVIAAFQ